MQGKIKNNIISMFGIYLFILGLLLLVEFISNFISQPFTGTYPVPLIIISFLFKILEFLMIYFLITSANKIPALTSEISAAKFYANYVAGLAFSIVASIPGLFLNIAKLVQYYGIRPLYDEIYFNITIFIWFAISKLIFYILSYFFMFTAWNTLQSLFKQKEDLLTRNISIPSQLSCKLLKIAIVFTAAYTIIDFIDRVFRTTSSQVEDIYSTIFYTISTIEFIFFIIGYILLGLSLRKIDDEDLKSANIETNIEMVNNNEEKTEFELYKKRFSENISQNSRFTKEKRSREKFCPYCSSPLKKNSNFCETCGKSIKDL